MCGGLGLEARPHPLMVVGEEIPTYSWLEIYDLLQQQEISDTSRVEIVKTEAGETRFAILPIAAAESGFLYE